MDTIKLPIGTSTGGDVIPEVLRGVEQGAIIMSEELKLFEGSLP